jgi:serine/threonine protein kinase
VASELLEQLQEVLGTSYRVTRELGGGGMSRVFVAEETELERQVVVKVLSPDLAAGLNADRFRREIQLAAKLQHPHIVPLLSAGAKGGLLYYTMPYIAGENLRARLVRLNELPVPEATKILREVADALEYAHENGVVHRDIKPENILFSGNHALVTDFGVSKALTSATSETPVGHPDSLTSLGVALGTPTYMSPEQAAADPRVDHRGDIYSLGIVGYEMLTGAPPFTGATPQQVLSAQVTATPVAVTQHRPNIPPALAATVMRCLEKHPSDRWQTASELRVQLETIFSPSGETQPVLQTARPEFVWNPQRIAVAAGVVGLIIAGLFASTIAFRRSGGSLSIANTRQLTNAPGLEIQPSLSPDGRMVAFVNNEGPHRRLFVRQVEGGRAIPLTDSLVGGLDPTWNPSGSQIYFSRLDGLHTVPALGGQVSRALADTTLYSCSWSSTGDRLACTSRADRGLYVADSRGANAKRLVASEASEPLFRARWSPGDRFIAYIRGNQQFLGGEAIGNIAPSSIWVVSAAGGPPIRVTDETHLNMSPEWMPDGSLLYVSSRRGARDIYLQKLDDRGHPSGDPARLTTGLQVHTISVSRDGHSLAYSVLTTVANVYSTAIPDRLSGTLPVFRPVTTGNQTVEQFFVSPDGKWLAYDTNLNGNQDIYKVALAGGEPEQLTHNGVDNFWPAWSPDGSEIAFHSMTNGNRDIYTMKADGRDLTRVVATTSQERSPWWSPHRLKMVYLVQPDSTFMVSRASIGAKWASPTFICTPCVVAKWSPDGEWISYLTQSGLWKRRADSGQSVQIVDLASLGRIPGGHNWSPDGRTIYFSARPRRGDYEMWKVASSGGEPAQLLRFDDPSRKLYRPEFAIDSSRFYFTMGSSESDIWIMELARDK